MVHVSLDCVLSGRKGQYAKVDLFYADGLYGKCNYIDDLRDMKHAITLRTSIIGRALNSSRALVD